MSVRPSFRRLIALAATLPIAGLVVVAAAAPAQAGTAYYAYANGVGDVTGCASTLTPDVDGCTLTAALSDAGSGSDVIVLGTAGSDFHYVGNWTAPTSVEVQAADGLTDPPVLDGNHGVSTTNCTPCDRSILTVGAGVDLSITGVDFESGFNESNGGAGAIDNGQNVVGGTLTIDDCTFLGNQSDVGGGAIANGRNGDGTVIISNSTFDSNGSGFGGAIDNADGGSGPATGTISVTNSTFASNSASDHGGAIDSGDDSGGGTLTVTDSTFGNNSASSDGGAIDAGDDGGAGTVSVTSSTFSGNQALNGGAIDSGDYQGGGKVAVATSTFATNTATDGPDIDDGDIELVSAGGSFVSVHGGGTVAIAGDVFGDACDQVAGTWDDEDYNVGIDASCLGTGSDDSSALTAGQLGSLVDNGGPTKTIALLAGNPAISLIPPDTAPAALNSVEYDLCSRYDQRGVPTSGGKPCDAGALVNNNQLYAYADGSDVADSCAPNDTPADGCSLGAALNRAGAGFTVNLATSGDDAHYIGNWALSPTGTMPSSPVTITAAPGVASAPVLDGNKGVSGVPAGCTTIVFGCGGPILSIGPDVFAQISLVTFVDADNDGGQGGAIDVGDNEAGNLVIRDSTFTDNHARFGGAINNGSSSFGSASLDVGESTFNGNTADNDGGAIDDADLGGNSGDDGLTVRNSTFVDNSAGDNGGAIDHADGGGSGDAAVLGSTFTGNTASVGDSIASGEANGNSVTAVAADVFDGGCDYGTDWDDAGYNAGTDASCETGGTADKSTMTHAELEPLANNGGVTETVELGAGNPAIALVPSPAVVSVNSFSTQLCPRRDQLLTTQPLGVACEAGAIDLFVAGSGGGGVAGPPPVTPSITVSGAPNPSVFGQPVSWTASLSTAPSCGQVRWLIDGVQQGPTVDVSTGRASGGGLAFTLGPVSTLGAGSHEVQLVYLGCPGFTDSSAGALQIVAKAATTTTVTVSGTTATATVESVAPGAGSATGTVTFHQGNNVLETVPLVGGAASVSLSATPATVSARRADAAGVIVGEYNGDANFTGSSGSSAGPGITNPTITANVTSAHPKSKAGWYRGPVHIAFTCKAGSAPLATPCPDPVTLSASSAAQSVTATITAIDGGAATAVVSPINIDTTPPTVRVTGAKNRHTYRATRHLTCHATDALSGVATCTVNKHRIRHAHSVTVHYIATATDQADNTATQRGHYTIRS